MTDVQIVIEDVLGRAPSRGDRLWVRAARTRSGTGGQVVAPVAVPVEIYDNPTIEMEPGPARVRFELRNLAVDQTREFPVTVPSEGPVTLRDILDEAYDWTPEELSAFEQLRADAVAAAEAAEGHAQAASGHASAAAADREATGLDRVATGADREQTGLDRTQTGLDRVATGEDRQAAEAAAVEAGAAVGSVRAAALGPDDGDGELPSATGVRAVAVGYGSIASSDEASALGGGRANGFASTALGGGASADGTASVALGMMAHAPHHFQIALGTHMQVSPTEYASHEVHVPGTLVLYSPDRSMWAITVDNAGQISASPWTPPTTSPLGLF